jgi:hypothetical protein
VSAASTKENKLGIMPINRLLIDVSLPIMISMFVQALYNIVDSILWPGSMKTPSPRSPWLILFKAL